jgi:hypothetical protein
VDEENDAESGPTTWLDSGTRWGENNAREGDGDGESPPVDRESEDEDGNRWWLRSSDSLILPAPLFFELDALINRVTLKEKKYKTRKKMRKTTHTTHRISWSRMILPTPSSASFNDRIVSLHSSTPYAYRLSASLIPANEPATDMIT